MGICHFRSTERAATLPKRGICTNHADLPGKTRSCMMKEPHDSALSFCSILAFPVVGFACPRSGRTQRIGDRIKMRTRTPAEPEVCAQTHGEGTLKQTGLLKRYILPIGNIAFCTNIKGHHHLQGNVQVYNVRIPETPKGEDHCPFLPGRAFPRARIRWGGGREPSCGLKEDQRASNQFGGPTSTVASPGCFSKGRGRPNLYGLVESLNFNMLGSRFSIRPAG